MKEEGKRRVKETGGIMGLNCPSPLTLDVILVLQDYEDRSISGVCGRGILACRIAQSTVMSSRRNCILHAFRPPYLRPCVCVCVCVCEVEWGRERKTIDERENNRRISRNKLHYINIYGIRGVKWKECTIKERRR